MELSFSPGEDQMIDQLDPPLHIPQGLHISGALQLTSLPGIGLEVGEARFLVQMWPRKVTDVLSKLTGGGAMNGWIQKLDDLPVLHIVSLKAELPYLNAFGLFVVARCVRGAGRAQRGGRAGRS